MELICELNDKIVLGRDGLSGKTPRLTARASLDYTQINDYFVVTTTHTPGENHLTESERESRTEVRWLGFDEMVRRINEQEFDRIQGKYLKARDVAALKAYAAWNSDKT